MRFLTEYYQPSFVNSVLVHPDTTYACNNGGNTCVFTEIDGRQCETGDIIDAYETCEAIGARLCTADEIVNAGTIEPRCKGSLRGRDFWTADVCEGSRRIVVELSGEDRIPRCKAPFGAHSIACCADDNTPP